MPDINWGGDEATAPFSSRLDETAGNFILAEDNDGSTVLLEYDGSTWQYRGPVEMNGEDISGVGTLTATDATVSGTVDAGTVSTGEIGLGKTLIKQDEFALSDDSATSFSDFEESQFFYLMGGGQGDGHAEGVLVYQSVKLGAATDDVATLKNTALTGTTGTDGKLTLSMSDTTLYVENRVGRDTEYRLIRFQGSPRLQ